MIGSWLIKELLARNAIITVLVQDMAPQSELCRSRDIERVSVVNGTLEEFWTLERAVVLYEIDTVFHLGAQTIVPVAHQSPFLTFETNIRGTYNLLEICRLHPNLIRRILIASSDKAYGEQTTLPYTEDMPLNGRHPYEVSKSCADLIAQAYAKTYGLGVAIARCGNVFGGGDLNWSRLVPDTIRSLHHGERPVIRSDGTYLRDYIYVKDVTQAYLRLAESLQNNQVRGDAFNFSLENPINVLEMVTQIRKFMDCMVLEPRIQDCVVGEIRKQHLSSVKARTILGWKPMYSLEAGLKETIDWYRCFFGKKLISEMSKTPCQTQAI